MGKYNYTKTELVQRWSKRLVEQFFPQCTETQPNPYYDSGTPMKLYDGHKVREIERTDTFREEWTRAMYRKICMKKARLGK